MTGAIFVSLGKFLEIGQYQHKKATVAAEKQKRQKAAFEAYE
jgi:hypothetical protein